MGNVKRVAIIQSSYIPWKGYFDIIRSVDEFVLFDDVQYTKRDWRSRNQIQSPNGPIWLTIPVDSKGKYLQKICDAQTSDTLWAEKHWKSISLSYAKTKGFEQFGKHFSDIYSSLGHERSLSQVNFRLISALCSVLDIKTKITWSSQYQLSEGKNERLADICLQAGATHYLSGPSAKNYIDEELFQKRGIEVCWADYSGYPEYASPHGLFRHDVSVLDLIFNEGENALQFMKKFL